MATGSNQVTMRVVLIGPTGCGKSALGNTLLGSKKFVSIPAAGVTGTTCIQEGSGTLPSGKKIRVVDTPGITYLNKQSATSNVNRSIELLSPGPHAFIIVLNPRTLNEHQLRPFISELVDLFGSEYFFKHSIIVIVSRNQITDDDGNLFDIHEFIGENNLDDLKKLYTLCDQRIVAVENQASKHEQEIYAQEVADVISAMDGYFSYDYFLLKKQDKRQEDHLIHLQNALKTKNRSSCSIM